MPPLVGLVKLGVFVPPLIVILPGIAHSRSATRIGYIGNNGWDNWSGEYDLLDGKMGRTMHFDSSKSITLETTTESGTLSVEIKDNAGNVIFSQSDIGTISHNLLVNGNIVVTISANKHRGSFAIN